MDNYLCINYLLTTAQHNIFNIFKKALSPYDITPAQYGVLNCLWKNEGDTAREIALCLQLDISTVSGILDRMEKKNLISRATNPSDRRKVLIVLTPQARELESSIIEVIENLNSEIMGDFTVEERENLNKVLRDLAHIEL